MSTFWTVFIAVITIANVLACWWLIWWTSKSRPDEVASGEVTDHVWDQNLREKNNPMPRWWLNLFHITIVFTLVYVLLFPSLGGVGGLLGWSSDGQWEEEVLAAEERYGPIYAQYAGVDVATLAADEQALKLGEAVFINNCTTCHGSDGRGARGFPNLADADWQWGGDPDTILQTISHGRNAAMPALGAALGEDGVAEVVEYVRSLSGLDHEAAQASAGKSRFDMMCAACHGANAKGNPLFGAPNLSDETWLYGSSRAVLTQTINAGRNGMMPAHNALIGEDRARLVAAYVYQLGKADQLQAAATTTSQPTASVDAGDGAQ
ncbi:MAG: cytochrome-c oxidase, cbb3-type subunit III [Pseudomonadota bacterium]